MILMIDQTTNSHRFMYADNAPGYCFELSIP
jgi:hypothetical protein